ncbi:MAG: PAS domain S-box protein [bacterium]|nr:PAS domain S-box protein [bacterium]
MAVALAAIVNSSHDAVIAKSLDGTITTWSPGASVVYGGDAVSMLGRSIEDLIPPEAREAERAIRQRVASGESESGYHCWRIRADGEPIEVVMSMSPVRNGMGEVVGVASISRPISSMERDARRFASLLEAAPDAVLCVDPKGIIGVVNAQACAMFGYPRPDLIGIDLSLLLPQHVREKHRHHLSAYFADPHVRSMGVGLALTGRRRDGSEFPVEISLAPDASGPESLVIAAVRDVTERHRLELNSRESETRLRQLAESVDILFILRQVDPPQILYISPASSVLFGRTSEEMLASDDPLGLVIHPEDLA